ncbi:HAD-IC family P-type ATPase [Nonomuraea angiospora]
METAHKLETIVLDKTGTITRGQPALSDVLSTGPRPADDLLRLAAGAERSSEHPLGHAVVTGAAERGLSLAEVSRFGSQTSKGVSVTIEGHQVLVGGHRLLEGAGVEVAALRDATDRLAEQGRTPIMVAVDGQPAGVLSVADTVKDDSQDAVAALRLLGLQVVMITGDNRRTAEAIARQVGITRVLAEVLPEHTAVRLSRATMRNIRQNLFLAFVYNTVGIPIAAGILYPFLGIRLSPIIAAASPRRS